MELMEERSIDPDPARIHLIGYSMGGYVCAAAAEKIMTDVGVKIGQLTGLDVPKRRSDWFYSCDPIQIDDEDFGAVEWCFLDDDEHSPCKVLMSEIALRKKRLSERSPSS